MVWSSVRFLEVKSMKQAAAAAKSGLQDERPA